jgi:membrane peptidoglycan carboxypeptidase
MSRLEMFNKNKAAQRQGGGLRRFASIVWRLGKGMALLGLVGGVVGLIVGGWYYKRHVVDEPGEHLQREAILAIIAQESPVLYSDGQTRIGTFFDKEHREYVAYGQIPEAWVHAIVASEDQHFYDHPGVDPTGIARAMVQNVKAGRMVAGGSTLTQQTAKNLYYRPDRSLSSKLTELVNALRLEAHYSKEEILEFYANQFHVSANGRGLGIAARYFFDKEVGELSTLECAFIAGMVKGPALYNPFVGATEERRAEARRRGQARVRYVLDRMRVMGTLSEAEHAQLVAQELNFKRGSFRYDSNILVDEVAARLEQAPFPALFADLGIDNPSTAGISVVTTLNREAQLEATYALWHHLSDIGAVLDGVGLAALRLPADAPIDDRRVAEVHAIGVGRVSAAAGEQLSLDMGGVACTVDKGALDRMVDILRRSGVKPIDRARVVASLSVGDKVLASFQKDASRCDLELRATLQGALILLDRGQIVAMVGGNDNRNFNRAITARRQFGSTWKPLVYATALQLGWTPADLLDNRENTFPFEGSWYYPRADHTPDPTVSLGWAGVRSENLASVWLLAHLIDRLDSSKLQEIAALLDLLPRHDEEKRAYAERIRDDSGVISTAERIPEIAWVAARNELATILEVDGKAEEALLLRSLHYGRGAEAEEARLRKRSSGAELEKRLRAVRRNHLALRAGAEGCLAEAERLSKVGARAGGVLSRLGLGGDADRVDASAFSALSVRREGARLEVACGGGPSGYGPVDDAMITEIATGSLAVAEPSELRVEGLRLSLLDEVQRNADRLALVLASSDPYSFEVLQHHPDYRALLSIRYLAAMAHKLGVQEEIPTVLSMPLGAVDISLEEAASIYQGFLGGQRWSAPGEQLGPSAVPGLRSSVDVSAPASLTQLIAEIRDRDGQVIYKATPAPEVVMDPVAGRLLGDAMRNVVLYGTGQRARSVKLGSAVVPVAGKTGTTNGFKNAAFCGFIPRARAEGWSWGEGFTLAAYVGFDDNRPMTRGSVRVAGAAGALPAWVALAQGLADRGLLGAAAPADPEWAVEEGFRLLPVDPEAGGLPVAEGGSATILIKVEERLLGEANDPQRRIVLLRNPAPAVPIAPPGSPPAAPVEAPLPEEAAPAPVELPEGSTPNAPPATPPDEAAPVTDTGVLDPRIAPR